MSGKGGKGGKGAEGGKGGKGAKGGKGGKDGKSAKGAKRRSNHGNPPAKKQKLERINQKAHQAIYQHNCCKDFARGEACQFGDSCKWPHYWWWIENAEIH